MKDLSISAQFIKGVGPARLKVLNRLGIETVDDLLYCFPHRYEDRSKVKSVREAVPGNFETIRVKVLMLGEKMTKRGMSIFKMAVGDWTGVIYAVWFNQPYMKDKFKIGNELILYGKIEKQIQLQINNPEYEILRGAKDDYGYMGKIVPVYGLTESLNQRWFRNILKFAVDNYIDGVVDALPFDIRRRNNLIMLKEAIRNIHFPVSEIVLQKAKARLIFDEFFILQVGIMLKRAKIKMDLGPKFPSTLTLSPSGSLSSEALAKEEGKGEGDNLIDKFKASIPFELTKSQLKVIKEIEEDMQAVEPMNRLLQGDVGSGKTIVSLYAIILAIQNGYQAALMVPTEVLAQQHYKNIKALVKDLDINVALLAGDMAKGEYDRRRHMIEIGESDIIIGTHSIIQEGVHFKNLGLAVIDEQHKFGVMQRLVLKSKSFNPHVLVMTATPIPRTLALTVYGDLDISIIDELPPGRQAIRTLYFEEQNREKAYKIANDEVRIGRQVYVVYPLIEESEKSDLRAAIKMHKYLSEKFPDLRVGLLHGRMKSDEKERIMQDFKERKLDILISTIVIEVGVDISNASTMIVEHAERFGLSQLHQLRGRIGRGEYMSYCILVGEPKTDDAKARISAMLETQDGFKIAEKDLEIRGPGEFFGTRQHGLPELRIANIIRDRVVLEIARKEAMALIEKDRFLRQPENRLIRESLKRKFKVEELELAAVG